MEAMFRIFIGKLPEGCIHENKPLPITTMLPEKKKKKSLCTKLLIIHREMFMDNYAWAQLCKVLTTVLLMKFLLRMATGLVVSSKFDFGFGMF